ncbi:low molecular weight phosphatase family protein [Demequina sp. NBRC 110055]|uniref:arsenate reductase/protein-tyrosine-phosphatase family protein n=1 Tax=Demequina sp. NBRC 110055 TaxID=1570344 RepID=UPI00135669DB|nr:low molecular weight phosphatase family protein [Demequina sp. NBRC 110055]
MTSILTVCTGNICRSPAAELLLKEYLGDLAAVSSAGVGAMVGRGIPTEMLMNLDGAGIDGRGHAARQLTSTIASEAGIVVAMTHEHRTEIVQQTPAALRRTVLFDELVQAARAGAELEGDTPAERLADIPEAIAAFRPQLAGMEIADVPDPYGREQEAYDESFAIIESGVKDIADWIRGETPG